MEADKKALSDIVVFNKYAKWDASKGRRENYREIVQRNKEMHQRKYPQLAEQIEDVYQHYVLTKKVLPSMRSLQFGGRPIELAHNRIFNCAYMPAEDYHFFPELMFLLLGGTGMGYSVQSHHVNRLPPVTEPKSRDYHKFQVQDSIVGWADAIKVVAKAFLCGGALPAFDYRDIREKGSELVTTGGQAPGPDPLRACVDKLVVVFNNAVGRQLRPLEVHDAACIIADAVLAGGIRRAAMISLFDLSDEEMITCKSGNWWETHPYRARSNNSAVLVRGEVSCDQFVKLMARVEESGCGEPGVYWNTNKDWGSNPCCEIALEPYQMCNLTELNASLITCQDDYDAVAAAGAFIGTLQAGYTDFHYLNPKWRETCERGALLGVSMTGIASRTVTELDMRQAAECAVEENKRVAKLIGIRRAERITTVKPAGTTSLVLGCSSGIHAWHNDYYIRRMRAGKDEELAQYMMRAAPALVEQDVMVPHQVVLSFPQKAPDGACVRTESIFNLLDRVKKVSQEWVDAGHGKGDNRHNVSCTISVKDNEWEELTNWMWINREHYNGISVLPYHGAEAYPQKPFEDCTKEEYDALLPHLEAINIDEVFEQDGKAINLSAELACAGNFCELN
jgi:ribonucleoside-diphosphate reductase alpha chain